MSYEKGLIKYILKGPFTNPVAFFIYGSFFLAILNGLIALESGGNLFRFIIEYYSTKYLPPTTLKDIIYPIFLGSVVAGVKWYINVPKK